LISPILVTLLASGFHKYPFSGRVLLFIVPSVLILIAEGVQQIIDITKYERPIIGITLTALLVLHPLLSASYHLIRPRANEEIKPILNYVREHLQDGDVLYVHNRASYAFEYYKEKHGFTDRDYFVGKDGHDNWRIYISDLDRLRGSRVWMIFSHWSTVKREVHRGQIVDQETFFIYQLDNIGTMLDSFKSSGAACYLYYIN